MPHFSCKLCINYDICMETCQPLEDALREQGVYSRDYIRKHAESPFDNNKLDIISIQQAQKLKYGKLKIPKIAENSDFSA